MNGAKFWCIARTLTVRCAAGIENEVVFHHVNDVKEADVFWWRGEHVAAAFSLERDQIACIFESWHDFKKIVVRNVHLICDDFS